MPQHHMSFEVNPSPAETPEKTPAVANILMEPW